MDESARWGLPSTHPFANFGRCIDMEANRNLQLASSCTLLIDLGPASRARVAAPVAVGLRPPQVGADATGPRGEEIVTVHGRVVLQNARWVSRGGKLDVGEVGDGSFCRFRP